MNRIIRRCAIGAVLLPIIFAAPVSAQEHRPRRPNVLFLLADDQRPGTIAALGNKIIHTPHLDSLVRQGAAFTRAVCPNPICTPSRAEIVTGCSGFRNGVLYFGDKIKAEMPLWARTMSEAGYRTCYVGKGDPDPKPSRLGYEESLGLFAGGGSRWEKERKDFNGHKVTGYRGYVFRAEDGRMMPEKGVGLTPNISAVFADAAIRFLRRQSSKPFFLHVNFTAPHDPLLMPSGYQDKYDPKKIPLPVDFLPQHPFDHGNLKGRDELLLPFPRTPKDVRRELAVYYAVISHLDEQIGRILAVLKETGQVENTLVIFSSDHGLALGSHGLRGKQNMYEHTIGVPLMFRGPGIPKGKRFETQCYLRDLFPTVCDLAGVAVPPAVEGKSLAPVMAGKTKTLYPYVFGHFRDVQRMVRGERWKLISYPKIDMYQLFDLSHDPDELHNLAADPRHTEKIVTTLRRELTKGPWR